MMMELELVRKYFSEGTNGELLYMDRLVTYTIELPWKNNLARVSCIPEGRYELIKRWSLKFNWHLQIMNVSQRSSILIHPANDATRELKGCIAPVCLITGAGKGIKSRLALRKLTSLVFGAHDQHDKVFITIKKDHYELS